LGRESAACHSARWADSNLNVKVPIAAEGKYSRNADGTPKADDTYWKGFKNRIITGRRSRADALSTRPEVRGRYFSWFSVRHFCRSAATVA